VAAVPAPARRRACLAGGHCGPHFGERGGGLVPTLDAAPGVAGLAVDAPALERAIWLTSGGALAPAHDAAPWRPGPRGV
jgi:hypothetical protein